MSKLASDPGGGGALRGRVRRPGGAQGDRPVAQDRVGGVRLGSRRGDVVAACDRDARTRRSRSGSRSRDSSCRRWSKAWRCSSASWPTDVFGPVVACGAGGTTAELLRDVAVRVAPITDMAAEEMVRSLATFPLLEGFRGAPKADVPALEEIDPARGRARGRPRRRSREMDCNPVMVGETRAVVVDSRVRVSAP